MPVSDSLATPDSAAGRTDELAWGALLTIARWARGGKAPQGAHTFAADPVHGLRPVTDGSPDGWLERQTSGEWVAAARAPRVAKTLLDLYLPICNASAHAPLTVGHLGQSLDGYIATTSGDSDYVTGPENLLHLHRMRALCDAVLVGAETVATDDPQLTVRRTIGENPLRIILDPQRRLAATHGVFSDGAAPTLLLCDEARLGQNRERIGSADLLGLPTNESGFDLIALLRALHARRLYTLFIEGGGKTVSTFLDQGLLDRLQIAIAPLVTGAGRPGICLPARARIADCLRLPHRVYVMGDDVLFDCELRRGTAPLATNEPSTGTPRRII